MSSKFSRRRFLMQAGAGAAAWGTGGLWGPWLKAAAQERDDEAPPLLALVYFQGGWDTLLCLDARDNRQHSVPHRDSPDKPPPAHRRIETNYESISAAGPVLAQTGGSGIVEAGGIEFGPLIGDLAQHADDLCVLRGVNMNTASHTVGMRYFLTGRLPAGTTGEGNSLTTWVAGHYTDTEVRVDGRVLPRYLVPNIALSLGENYNADLDPQVSALRLSSADVLEPLLAPQHPQQAPRAVTQRAIERFHGRAAHHDCLRQAIGADGSVHGFHSTWQQTRPLMSGELFDAFRLVRSPPAGSTVARAYRHLYPGVADPTATFGTPLHEGGARFQMLLAAIALTEGVTQVVGARVAQNLDHHSGSLWSRDAGPQLQAGLDAVAGFISYLKDTADPWYGDARSLWERTTLLVFSEFARRPFFNQSGGRDHHLSGACLLAGPGLRGGLAFGGTDDRYDPIPVDLRTGELGPGGRVVAPQDVHATLCRSMGVPVDPQLDRNVARPEIIDHILRGGA